MSRYCARTGDNTATVVVTVDSGRRTVEVRGDSGHTTVLPASSPMTDQIAANACAAASR